MTNQFFGELIEFFSKFVYTLGDVRAIALTGEGKHFTSGLDLKEAAGIFTMGEDKDQGRRGIAVWEHVRFLQKAMTVIEKCRVPVVAGVHGYCLGAGIDLITCCDIRFCEEGAQFSIKEIDIGIVADLGTLQRLPNVVGNDSLMREFAYSGRLFGAKEAKELGLVSRICKDKKELEESVIAMAKVIAEKSPVVVWGLKKVLNRNRKSNVKEGLDYVAMANMSLVTTSDVMEAVKASMTKTKPQFPKL
eukprot:CAMPEP_0176441766 /NCGR_PEP_ID=MMETSP0127-20121128/21407_1 /TAXON_ID=938130 /ORGANISM="Platyophrya macrostoma, Strain WH" /LENGTH=246 /DNA_ID=CAMNT_0017826635 /DNA_START=123 /DNA_END=863 /DNA_ORIENTATION=-